MKEYKCHCKLRIGICSAPSHDQYEDVEWYKAGIGNHSSASPMTTLWKTSSTGQIMASIPPVFPNTCSGKVIDIDDFLRIFMQLIRWHMFHSSEETRFDHRHKFIQGQTLLDQRESMTSHASSILDSSPCIDVQCTKHLTQTTSY